MLGTIKNIAKLGGTAFKEGTGMGAKPFMFFAGANTVINMGVDKKPLGESMVKGAFDAVLWTYAMGPMTAWTFATQGPQLGVAVAEAQRVNSSKWNAMHHHEMGGQYQDTQAAYDMRRAGTQSIQDSMLNTMNASMGSSPATMRQSAMQAIQGSQLNGRSSLGSEARLMHRSYRDRG